MTTYSRYTTHKEIDYWEDQEKKNESAEKYKLANSLGVLPFFTSDIFLMEEEEENEEWRLWLK